MNTIYRADLAHDPNRDVGEWEVTIYRVSDGSYVGVDYAHTAAEAIVKAQSYIVARNTAAEPFSIELDEDGNLVEGHSARV